MCRDGHAGTWRRRKQRAIYTPGCFVISTWLIVCMQLVLLSKSRFTLKNNTGLGVSVNLDLNRVVGNMDWVQSKSLSILRLRLSRAPSVTTTISITNVPHDVITSSMPPCHQHSHTPHCSTAHNVFVGARNSMFESPILSPPRNRRRN